MSDLVLEVTAGVGGQEAMLFTSEVFDMYQSFAAFQGWGFDVLEYTPSELGQQKLTCHFVRKLLMEREDTFRQGLIKLLMQHF